MFMIQVTKPGTPQPNKLKGKCFNCKCEIICDEKDLIIEDRPLLKNYVPCPTPNCGKWITELEKIIFSEKD